MTTDRDMDELRAEMARVTDAELRQALDQIDTPERRAEIARRLAPYRTPVTDATMRRGCGPASETLHVAAGMLAQLRWYVAGAMHPQINAMIDRCNLAAMGVPSEDSHREPLTLETATGRDLDFAGDILRRRRPTGETDYDFRDLLMTLRRRADGIAATGATAAEIERLRRFESGVTDLLGYPVAGTDKMLDRLRDALARKAPPDASAPSTILASHGWTDLGGGRWFHDVDGTAANVSGGAARVTGERDITGSELRALADLTDGHAPDSCAVLASHGWETVDGGVWQRGLNPPAVFIGSGSVTLGRGPAVSPEELRAFAALAEETQP